MLLKVRALSPQVASLLSPSFPSPTGRCLRNPFSYSTRRNPIPYPTLSNPFSYSTRINPNPSPNPPLSRHFSATSETAEPSITDATETSITDATEPPISVAVEPSITEEAESRLSEAARLVNNFYFVPPGVKPEEVTEKMILPGSNIVRGPHVGQHHIRQVEFVKSSTHAADCPKDNRPEFAVLGRSNVGKSSLINALVRRKGVAPISKKPGKTQEINHYLVNKKWYLVDLPGYGFAHAPKSVKMEWTSFTKGYFVNRETLVAVLLLVDPNVPPQMIDLDCACWLGHNDIPMTFVFTKCDKMRGNRGKKPDEFIRDFQKMIGERYTVHPPWIMTSSVTGLGTAELLQHMSQLRNYWSEE